VRDFCGVVGAGWIAKKAFGSGEQEPVTPDERQPTPLKIGSYSMIKIDLGGNVLPDLNLCSCACSFLCILKQLNCNLFTDIRLSTI
jgi:hypothetical protein